MVEFEAACFMTEPNIKKWFKMHIRDGENICVPYYVREGCCTIGKGVADP